MFHIENSIWDEREKELATRSRISHPSFKAPNPGSLIDLKFNKKPHEESAYIAFGRARNSLGLTLIVPLHRMHLIPALDREKIRYRMQENC